MSFLNRLFGKTEASSEILCPHCERAMDAGHDVDACARRRMSRRYFFGVLGGAAAAIAVAPAIADSPVAIEAGPAYFCGAQLLTPQMITNEILRNLEQNISAGMLQLQRDYNRHLSMIGENLPLREPTRLRRTAGFRTGDRRR